MMIPSGSLLPEDVMLLWELFSFVPIDDDDRIEEPFMGFPVGTDKLEIWHWFDGRAGSPIC